MTQRGIQYLRFAIVEPLLLLAGCGQATTCQKKKWTAYESVVFGRGETTYEMEVSGVSSY